MKDEMIREKIRQAVDHQASDVHPNPFLAQRVIAQATGKEKTIVKKKLSISMLLIIILLLATVTALAISILTGKKFVEDTLAPQATVSGDKAFTSEEITEIKQQLMNQGIVITPEIEEKLMSTDPIYKEELMRLFMKMDLGYYPASWPLEEQAWYDELLVEIGLMEERTRFLPEGDEITENQALEIAKNFIFQKWNVDVSNDERYVLRIQYMLTTDENKIDVKRWDITYECTTDNASYVIALTPEGTIIEDECSAMNIEAPKERDQDLSVDSNTDVMMLMWQDDFYTVESLAMLSERFERQILSYNNNWEETKALKAMLNNPYALPDRDEINPEEAMTKAKEIALTNGWTEKQIALCRRSISYRKYPEERPYYRICFKLNDGPENRSLFYQGKMPFGIVIYLDPLSGEVIHIQTLKQLDDFERYPEFPDPHDTVQNKGNG